MKNEKGIQLNRRQMMLASTSAIASLLSPNSLSENTKHSLHKPTPVQLINQFYSCIQTGEMCIEHCIQLIKNGDNRIAQCLFEVTQMITLCKASVKLATLKSAHLDDIIKICTKSCETCEKECMKHASRHTICKKCAEECARCIDAMRKV